MSRSARPNIEQIQRVTRLICECVELGCDPILWRRHLANGVIELFPDSVVLIYELSPPLTADSAGSGIGNNNGNGNVELNPILIEEGWIDDGCRSAFFEYLESGVAVDSPMLNAIMAQQESLFETSAYELEPESSWWRRPDADYMIKAGVEMNCLTYASLLPSGRRNVLALHRHRGAKPLTKNERTLLAMLFRSIAPIMGTMLRPIGEPTIIDLPPRVIGVLNCFLRGLSSKQAADERNLSVNTVNEYSKAIHRHFGVQSRGELLARMAGVSHRHQIERLFGK